MKVWMSGPPEAVARGAYNNGPAPWHSFHPDKGDIIVAKTRSGKVISAETWDGEPYEGEVK